jgi:hypothetical protein
MLVGGEVCGCAGSTWFWSCLAGRLGTTKTGKTTQYQSQPAIDRWTVAVISIPWKGSHKSCASLRQLKLPVLKTPASAGKLRLRL